MYRVGIDIGSTTVKIAILDDGNQIIFSAYERHFANIQETLKNIIERALRNHPYDYRLGRISHFQSSGYPFRTGSYQCGNFLKKLCPAYGRGD